MDSSVASLGGFACFAVFDVLGLFGCRLVEGICFRFGATEGLFFLDCLVLDALRALKGRLELASALCWVFRSRYIGPFVCFWLDRPSDSFFFGSYHY